MCVNNFDGDAALQTRIRGTIDGRHTTTGKASIDLIPSIDDGSKERVGWLHESRVSTKPAALLGGRLSVSSSEAIHRSLNLGDVGNRVRSHSVLLHPAEALVVAANRVVEVGRAPMERANDGNAGHHVVVRIK